MGCEGENLFCHLINNISIERQVSRDPSDGPYYQIDILCQRITYIYAQKNQEHLRDYQKKYSNLDSIFVMVPRESKAEEGSSSGGRTKELECSDSEEKDKTQNGDVNHRSSSINLGKRIENPMNKSSHVTQAFNTKYLSDMDNKSSFLHNYAKRLSSKYKERRRPPKEIIVMSVPSSNICIDGLMRELEDRVYDGNQRKLSNTYLELVYLIRLASESLIIYRDSGNQVLIIYFKRLLNECLDGNAPVFLLVRTSIEELANMNEPTAPFKIRNLLRDISCYMSLQEINRRVSNPGQNKHFFLLSPIFVKSEQKKSFYFDYQNREYVMQMETSRIPGVSSVWSTCVRIPRLFYLYLFSFDYQKDKRRESLLGFKEAHEVVLKNDNGETFLLMRENGGILDNYLQDLNKYNQVVFDILKTLTKAGKVFYMDSSKNVQLYYLDDINQVLEALREKDQTIEAWFNFNPVQNKLLFFKEHGTGADLANLIDLTEEMLANIHRDKGRSTFGVCRLKEASDYFGLFSTIMHRGKS
jgi:hypothetical protein